MAKTGHPWCAAALDLMMRPLLPARDLVVPAARGTVLEIGVGTGLNFPLYRGLRRLIGVDPDPHMLRRAQDRALGLRFPVTLVRAGAERIPLEAERVDTAVVTFSLCTIPDPEAALGEIRRVLKPGGRLLFAEHVRSPQRWLGRVQDTLTPLWRQCSGGCHLNRRASELVRASGLALESLAPIWRTRWTLLPVYRGLAVKTATSGHAPS